DRERDRDRERQRQRQRDIDRDRERERQRQRQRRSLKLSHNPMSFLLRVCVLLEACLSVCVECVISGDAEEPIACLVYGEDDVEPITGWAHLNSSTQMVIGNSSLFPPPPVTLPGRIR